MCKKCKSEVKIRIELTKEYVLEHNNTAEPIIIDSIIKNIEDKCGENNIQIDNKFKLLNSFVIRFDQKIINFEKIKSLTIGYLNSLGKSNNKNNYLAFYILEGRLMKNEKQ